MSKLKKFIEHPWVNLIAGLILIATCGVEIVETLEEATIGAHHGVAFLGLMQTLQYLPHLLEGSEKMSKISRDQD